MAPELAKSTPNKEAEENVFKFGNSDLSDVIFDVGGKEFHCHKMLLAAKCDYFAAMFASRFKEKDQERIMIDANPIPFKQLMEIIYNGYIANIKDFIVCGSYEKMGITYEAFNTLLWDTANDLFSLADRFLLTDVVRHSFENALIRYDRECPYDKKGVHCAVKLLLALCHGMDEYKSINVSPRVAIKKALARISGEISMCAEAMAFLFERQ